MADTLVENRICEACGVDVRPGSLFCYNCGESVQPKTKANDEKENVSQIWFRENVGGKDSESSEAKTEAIKINENSEVLEKAEAENIIEKPVEVISEKQVTKTEIHEQAKLKSAASLRRKSKVIQRKKVEVVWEEHENAPNGWFIAAAITLTAIAATVIFLAMRLR